jgi:hypothetical protein
MCGDCSLARDDEHCLIVNAILFPNLAQMVVFSDGIFNQCVADVFCRKSAVFSHDRFDLQAFFLIAAVINPVGVKEDNVSRASSA